MRKTLWLGAIVLALGASQSASAQQRSAFASPRPEEMNFNPIDTRNVVGGTVPQGPGAPSKASSFFSKLSPTNWFSKPVITRSHVPVTNSFKKFGSQSN